MAILSQITGTPLTNIRSNRYHAQQFVALVPNSVVYQAQPSSAPTDNVFASINMGTAVSGSISNVLSFMTVIFSTTSDYRATETYRTYARAGSSGSTLNVAQNSQAITTSDYVTVLNTYEVFEKPAIQRGYTFMDWDISFRRILPTETSLPSAVVLTDGTTSYNPTATPSALDDNATSSFTHSWTSSNSNDSVTSATTASPTFTLEAGAFRWIRYTFTDSNGNAGLRVIAVWTVATDYSNVVSLGFVDDAGGVADISYDDELGWNCAVPAWNGIDDVLAGTMLCVFSENTYNGTQGAIRTNIDFVGYLGQETTRTRGDANFGVISEAVFECNSVGALISQTPVSTLAITATTTPSVWFEIDNPTPIRVVQLLLSELSTVSILCSMSFFSTHTDFIGNGDIFSNTPDVLFDALKSLLDTVKAKIQYDTDGRMDIARELIYLDNTARNAATTVVQFQPSDFTSYSFVFNPVPQVRQLQVAGGWFDSTFGIYTPRIAYVPPITDNRGTDNPNIVNKVLTTDSTASSAESELAQRAGDLYAGVNPTPQLQVDFKDEWYFLVPDVGVWFTFNIALTDTARGIVYDSNTRWQLIAISHTTNNDTGRRSVRGTFRRETQGGGAFIDIVQPVQTGGYAQAPITSPPYTDGNYDTSYPTKSPTPPDVPLPPQPNCDLGGFRVRSASGYTTSLGADLGEQLSISIRGSGVLGGDGGLLEAWRYATSQEEWVPPFGWQLADSGDFGDGTGSFDGYYNYVGGTAPATATLTLNFTFPSKVYVGDFVVYGGRNNTGATITTYDFQGDTNSFTINNSHGTFTANGIEGTVGTVGTSVRVDAERTFGSSFTVNEVELIYDCGKRSAVDSTALVTLDGSDLINVSIPAEGTDVDITETGLNVSGTTLRIFFDTGLTDGEVTIKSLRVSGTGATPIDNTIEVTAADYNNTIALGALTTTHTFTLNRMVEQILVEMSVTQTEAGIAVNGFDINHGTAIGDAFYYSEDGANWQAYAANTGFQWNGNDIASIPPFNASHEYTLYEEADVSGVQQYEFNSPYARTQAGNWSIQVLTCFLG